MTELGMTEQRIEALTAVANGLVAFDRATATWIVDGKTATGWPGRTYSELSRFDYLVVAPPVEGEPVGVSAVDLTDIGRAALRSEQD